MGVAIVLITGGEPFVRHDLPEIIQAFESRGVHVRMQTNGLATEEQIHRAIEYGGKDISISLDSLRPGTQDHINGRFQRSWERAVQMMATFTRYLPKESSFASLGCVLQRDNLDDVESVIRFGTAIGWLTSLVPIHTTAHVKPMGARRLVGFDSADSHQPARPGPAASDTPPAPPLANSAHARRRHRRAQSPRAMRQARSSRRRSDRTRPRCCPAATSVPTRNWSRVSRGSAVPARLKTRTA